MSDHDDDEKAPLRPLSDAEMEALEMAVSRYQDAMTLDGVRYLTQRGIDQHTAQQFRIGMVGSNPMPGDERKVGSLVIPYLDRHGRPLTYRFRCIREHDHRAAFHGKYMSRPDDPPRMFHVRSIWNANDTLEITEGEFDAMILNKLGLHAVAMPGAEHWQFHHARMVAGFNKVRMWADADEAGAKLLRSITKSVRNAKGIYLPTGKDVSDIYADGGPEAVLAYVQDEAT